MTTVLKLYIIKHSPNSVAAIKNLEKLMKDFKDEYKLEVVDVLEHPQLAEDEKIVATPTLIKELPTPLRKMIGDLSNKEKVILGLDLVKV